MILKPLRRSLVKDCAGAITIEMAVIAVAVFFMIPVIMDLTSLIRNGINLSSSLRAGVQVALVQPNNLTAISEAIALSGNYSTDAVHVTTAQFCECDGIDATCGTEACPGSSEVPATFLTINASYSVPTFVDYGAPGEDFFSVTRSTIVRVR